MAIRASRRGSLCTSLQICFLGCIPLVFLAVMKWSIFYFVILLWVMFCGVLYFRFKNCELELANKILDISKGKFFITKIKISAFNISAVRILQTPISKIFDCASCIIFTSGKVTILWGLRQEDAQKCIKSLCGESV